MPDIAFNQKSFDLWVKKTSKEVFTPPSYTTQFEFERLSLHDIQDGKQSYPTEVVLTCKCGATWKTNKEWHGEWKCRECFKNERKSKV